MIDLVHAGLIVESKLNILLIVLYALLMGLLSFGLKLLSEGNEVIFLVLKLQANTTILFHLSYLSSKLLFLFQ